VHTIFEMGLQRTLMYGVVRYWMYPFRDYLDGLGQALRRTTATLTGAVTQHKLTHGSGKQSKGVGTFLDSMLARVALGEGREGGKDVFTERRMVDNLLVAFLAGTDTTSNAMMWMLHTLAKDPVLQEDCAAEALSFDLDEADEATILARLPTIRLLESIELLESRVLSTLVRVSTVLLVL
jgi:cytochrome P450